MVTINLDANQADEDLLFDREPSVAVRSAVRFDASVNKVKLASAAGPSPTVCIGFAAALPTATTAKIRTEKILDGFTSLTPGLPVFLSLIPGEVTQTPPTGVGDMVQELGLALTATKILIRIDTDPTILS